MKVGGMVTEPIVEKQRRVGFQITNWLTKEHEVFAHETLKSRIRSGRYGVNIAALEGLGTRALAEARESADVIVIDEVGKMEVESEAFTKSVMDTLDAKQVDRDDPPQEVPEPAAPGHPSEG